MLELLGSAASVITGIGGTFLGAAAIYGRFMSARKEVDDVIRLARQLAEKYSDVDDDARQMRQEIDEAAVAVKKLFRVKG